MSTIPGASTSTKTSTVNGVTTTVTTVKIPGQPTRITTTTTTKVPAGQHPTDPRFPTQPGQPLPQGRPIPIIQQLSPQPPKPEEPKRKSGFFSTLKKHVLKSDDPPKRPDDQPKRTSSIFRKPPSPSPSPTPPQQQQYQQQPPTIIHHSTDDGPVDQLAEKMRQAALNRPNVTQHVEHHSSSTTTQNGKVVQQSKTSYSGDGLDDAIAVLKKSRPFVAPSFRERLDVSAIDFSREDGHARACPPSEAATIPRLSHYLTSPFRGDQVSQLRAIFTWLANNIIYDVPAFLNHNYGDQSAEAVLRQRKAVCEGYGNLYIALAEPAGLQVQKVIGVARGVDFQVGDDRLGSPHAWNAVNINGENLLIDATWGAGVCDLATRSFKKLFRPFFFLLRPNKLIYTHWPEDPREQFLDPPIDEKCFRGLPAIKPESWTLGIKLSGKHRGQVVRTKDDAVEVEVRLKKRPSDGVAGKIVAKLHWKNQALPTTVQWQREDEKYVYMAIKCWCPSSGSGEIHVFGWPPGGDQTKNGPQCLVYKVVNEGSGRAAKPLLQQYVVKGFAFSVLEPVTAQVAKGAPQTIRVRVFDVERGTTPAIAIQSPEGGMPERLSQVEPGLFEITKTLTAGQWKIVHMTSEYGFSFAAVFDAV